MKKNVLEILTKIINEEKDFKKDLILKEKEEIMINYIEFYIYSRLKTFFKGICEDKILTDLNDSDFSSIIEIDNFISFIKKKHFKNKCLFDDTLSNKHLETYFKVEEKI